MGNNRHFHEVGHSIHNPPSKQKLHTVLCSSRSIKGSISASKGSLGKKKKGGGGNEIIAEPIESFFS